MLYLDPHLTQPACTELTDENESSFFCPLIKTLKLSQICTAVAAGFYLRTLKDFEIWQQEIKALKSILSVYQSTPEIGKEKTKKEYASDDSDGFELIWSLLPFFVHWYHHVLQVRLVVNWLLHAVADTLWFFWSLVPLVRAEVVDAIREAIRCQVANEAVEFALL